MAELAAPDGLSKRSPARHDVVGKLALLLFELRAPVGDGKSDKFLRLRTTNLRPTSFINRPDDHCSRLACFQRLAYCLRSSYQPRGVPGWQQAISKLEEGGLRLLGRETRFP